MYNSLPNHDYSKLTKGVINEVPPGISIPPNDTKSRRPYLTKDKVDDFYKWYMNNYPFMDYINDTQNTVKLPKLKHLADLYKEHTDQDITLSHTRSIHTFYKFAKKYARYLGI